MRAVLNPGGSGRRRNKTRAFDLTAAGPESGADHFVRIRFAGHRVGAGRGARRPEKRVTARSKLPQKKCTGLHLPMNRVRNSLNTLSTDDQDPPECAATDSRIVGFVR